MRRLAAALALTLLAACSGAPKKAAPPPAASAPHADGPKVSPYAPAREDPAKRGRYTAGGLYAPGEADTVPGELPDVDRIPEPEVVDEPRSRYGNRSPYQVLGKSYRVMDDTTGYVERGVASYYGNKFHGRRTSNLEVYDMYAFTAAHRTLPLPSYARVTNLDNGRSVVVRVNDRGPFHDGRLIDLSFAAAVKLGIHPAGTGRVEVRALRPGDAGTVTAQAAPAAVPASAMDRLVAAIPASTSPSTPPSAEAAAATPVDESRFDMRRDGRPMTADEFDAWLKSRRITVATGRPADATAADAPAAMPAAEPSAADAVILQVASFTARANADRALAVLRGAGIEGRVQDAHVDGRQVWRLRVGPLAAEAATGLADRITGLGFGAPRRVRD